MKRWISLSLCFLLCLGLIIPVLLVVPASAVASDMSYNGVLLPNVELLRSQFDSSQYPNCIIMEMVSLGTLGFYCVFTTNDFVYAVRTSYALLSALAGTGSYIAYYLDNGSWVRTDSGSGSYHANYTMNSELKYIWANYDVYNLSDNSLYLKASLPVDPNAPTEVPDFGVLQSWLDTDVYTFEENGVATSFNVAVSGGSVEPIYQYQWYYGSSQGGEFTAIPNETQASFTPKTTSEYVGTSLYFCRITGVLDSLTKSADSGYLQVTVTEAPPPSTDPPTTEPSEPDTPDVPDETTPDYSEKLEDIQGSLDDVNNSIGEVGDKVDELPDKITDGMQDIMEQEKQEANSAGDSSAQEVIDIIPNPSDEFLPAIRNLVSVMSYDGTAAVLTMPAVSIPKIGSIVPNIKLLDAQEINFEQYVTLVPDLILNFIRALFDSALVIYCLYELFTMIGSALSGFVKNIGKEGLYE